MGTNQGIKEDVEIAAQVAAHIVEAKARLAARMHELGLTPAHGWRVIEELRNTPNGHEFVFRPIHLQEVSALEVTVPLTSDGRPVPPSDL
jgi:hypothetical protein